jgi:hypothetical protein
MSGLKVTLLELVQSVLCHRIASPEKRTSKAVESADHLRHG